MSFFEPFEPIGDSPIDEWSRRIQRASFGQRRLLLTPDTLTMQTSQGVFHRPKPLADLLDEERMPHEPTPTILPGGTLTNAEFRTKYEQRYGFGFFIATWTVERIQHDFIADDGTRFVWVVNKFSPATCVNCTSTSEVDSGGYVTKGLFDDAREAVIHLFQLWNGSEYATATFQPLLTLEFLVDPNVEDPAEALQYPPLTNTPRIVKADADSVWRVTFGIPAGSGIPFISRLLNTFRVGTTGTIQDGMRVSSTVLPYNLAAVFPSGMCAKLNFSRVIDTTATGWAPFVDFDGGVFDQSGSDRINSLNDYRLPPCTVTLRGHYAGTI